MIKLLLSITIWLRKYQGRSGNYYTISNATSILVVFIYLLLYTLSDIVGRLFNCQHNYFTSTPILLFIVILIGLILNQILILSLKRGRLHLRYREYQLYLGVFTIVSLSIGVKLLVMSWL